MAMRMIAWMEEPPGIDNIPMTDPTVNNTASIQTGKEAITVDEGGEFNIEVISKITSLSVIMMLSFFGNGMILIKVARYSQMRTVLNGFVCSISASDLLVTLFSMPLFMTSSLMNEWPFGKLVCVLHHYVINVSSISNSFIMLYISLNIYTTLVRQLIGKVNNRIALLLILGAWTIAVLMSIPWNISTILTEFQNRIIFTDDLGEVCPTFPPPPKQFEIYRYILVIAIGHTLPLFVILCCLILICCQIYSVRVKIRPSVVPLREMLFQSEMRTATSVITMITVYVICWLPYIVLLTLSCMHDMMIWELWFDIAIWLTWANKAINPTIYVMRNRNIWRCLRYCKERFRVTRGRRSSVYITKEPVRNTSVFPPDPRRRSSSTAMFFARSSIDSDIALTDASRDLGIATFK